MTPCKSWRTASGSRSLDKPQGRSTSAKRPFSLIPLPPDPSCSANPAAQNRKETTWHSRPLHDRVVVKRLEGEQKTKGGIIADHKKNSKKVSSNEEIAQIGKISANGDQFIGEEKTGFKQNALLMSLVDEAIRRS